MTNLKPVTWLGTSREDVKSFPEKVRRIVGTELMAEQSGYDPSDWKPMSSIGPGVREIRIQYEGQYRVIYSQIQRVNLRASCIPEKDAAYIQTRHRPGQKQV